MADEVVTVLLGGFEPLVGIGLPCVLRSDRQISVLGSDLEGRALQPSSGKRRPAPILGAESSGRDLSVV